MSSGPSTTPDPAADGARREGATTAARARHGDGTGATRDPLIVCDRLVRIFTADGVEVQALQGLDLVVGPGELTALVGASGSGKSTLLNILAGLDTPSAGAAEVSGVDLVTMDAAARLRYRREVVGFVWQQAARNLLPYLTAAQNIALPMQLAGGRTPRGKRAARVGELLELLGVGHCHDRRPDHMSGGEQQRVAIAVAMANSPVLLLADEPTGELDSRSADEILTAMRTVNEEFGTTVLIVTHDATVAAAVRRTVAIRDGRTSSEVLRRAQRDESGAEVVVAAEYVTVDRAGRLQLPAEFAEKLSIRDRARLALQPDHITVHRDDSHDA
ncbi:ABC transporter ATP-binding protein [Streptomyces sp. MUM 203J]|uniref:ABC transporter ATP-binding protein n=1 Tax=Streptomyces sp. MUM 203J TaxID=2791990 RepID=UPI001F038FB9|nr:ABC transporter ATP-binding protein [Streptomyces sp. MUM 203J]MCH0539005.1 ABC transporter ATP-binding protein [Streptomyces sp. MUM 203J]